VNSRAVSTSGSIARCSEREVSVLCIAVYSSDCLKMSKQSHLQSFDTEKFINEIQQLPAIWNSRSSSYSNRQEKTYACETLRRFSSSSDGFNDMRRNLKNSLRCIDRASYHNWKYLFSL
jgi:hypothetical protein